MQENIPPCIKKKSQRFPPLNTCPAVDLFVKVVSNEFSQVYQQVSHDNLSKQERQCINNLRHDKTIVIKQADKGGNVVVWPHTLYEREAYRQLNDTRCYKRLTFNPSSKFTSELNKILTQAVNNKTISKELSASLQVSDPVTPTLYLLPKIHKHATQPPGRPIISGRGCLTENVSRPFELYQLGSFFEYAESAPQTRNSRYKQKNSNPVSGNEATATEPLNTHTLEKRPPHVKPYCIHHPNHQIHPSVTARRSKNLRDLLVRSHYESARPKTIFESKPPAWGCKPCG
ncbi:uncharacterized protein [Engystomops pustulosus]|uniref:uncharacterized protein n=1 Tax=Engystomops pustulosus TaxID=76066 RepID=UPI003AFB4114